MPLRFVPVLSLILSSLHIACLCQLSGDVFIIIIIIIIIISRRLKFFLFWTPQVFEFLAGERVSYVNVNSPCKQFSHTTLS